MLLVEGFRKCLGVDVVRTGVFGGGERPHVKWRRWGVFEVDFLGVRLVHWMKLEVSEARG